MSFRLISRLLCLALLAFVATFSVSDAQAQRGTVRKPRPVLLSPAPGTVLHPGDRVQITWTYEGNVAALDPHWCEQELYFSLDGGQSLGMRLTLSTGIDVRSFDWTVPNIATDNGVFDIQFGCEANGFPHEVINLQHKNAIKIMPAEGRGNVEDIRLSSVPNKVKAGDVVTFGWESSIKDAKGYEIQVSYNRGGDFTSVGTTTGNTYSWVVPQDYTGTLLFRVLSTDSEGRAVDSGMWLKDIIKVTR